MEDFVKTLSNINNLIIYKEYSAREKKEDGLSAKELYNEIKKTNKNVKYCNNIKSLLKCLQNNISMAFVGAGNINEIAEKLIQK